MTSTFKSPSGAGTLSREASTVSVSDLPDRPGEWVLLSYRLPREPSGPRTAVWRKLRKLGVAQISDGLVALPAGPRTREQLEWLSEEVMDSGGTAIVWLATPGSCVQEHQLAQTMSEARAAEYDALVAAAAQAAADAPVPASAIRRLRNDLRAIQRRDYFPPPVRDRAEAAVQALTLSQPETVRVPASSAEGSDGDPA